MEDRPANQQPQIGFEKQRGVADVTSTRNLVHAMITLPTDEEERTAARLAVFRGLAGAGIPIYLIKLHDELLSFVLSKEDRDRAHQVLENLGFRFSITDSTAIVSVIAANMRESFGVMARIVEALLNAGVPILQTGDSHNSVSCLIAEEQLPVAVAALKKEFGLENRPVTAEESGS